MIYDIEKDRLVTDQVFELPKKPAENSFVEFDNYFTHYVGGYDPKNAPTEVETPPSTE